MSTPNIDERLLTKTAAALLRNAGDDRRHKNAIEKGVRFIREGRCEIVDDDTIRIYSDSGETYTTSLGACTNEGTGDDCPAFHNANPCKHRAALHILLLIQAEAAKDQECAVCNARWKADELKPVDFSRLVAGDTVPTGFCPDCDCFCYPVDAGSVH